MAISIHNSHFGMWTQIEPPTPLVPYWSEADDGTRHHVREVLAGLETHVAIEIEQLHAAAITAIIAAAFAALRENDRDRAVRLVSAASRLAGEIVGLWPVDRTPAG